MIISTNQMQSCFRYLYANFTACIVLGSFVTSLHAQVQPGAKSDQPDFSQVRKLIQEQMAAKSIPSLAVAVVFRGKIVWEEGFGFADREQHIRATEHTMYYLASVSKTFTATAIMMLNERKRIDLDRPIDDYIKPARLSSPLWNPAEATVRRVANHTAGLTTFGRNCFADQHNCHISPDETIQRYGVIFWRPGDHFDYSNLGYGILGEAVGRTSGKSYADFLRDKIFKPLGMRHASLAIRNDLKGYAATRYSSINGRRPPAQSATPGASGIYCSAHDLALFGLFHLKAHLPKQKAILSDSAIETMQNSTVNADENGRYGLGWWVTEDLHGFRSVRGQGGTDDAWAALQLIPSAGIAVVILANTGTDFPSKLSDEILSVLLPSYRQSAAIADNNSPTQRPPVGPEPSLTGNWVGRIQTYKGNVPLVFSIAQSGDVQAKLGSALAVPLKNAQFGSRFGKQLLAGRLAASTLGTDEDTGPEPYDLDFELYLADQKQGQKLYGSVTTRMRSGARFGARLSYWVELEKPIK
ncbi:MAG TPA: serine hydrolase domain-containing protein [Pyrinomonadaceae bacterium]|nr:serine hydrolase domain-containing protein [Pyrinomonadaceae bacterium]